MPNANETAYPRLKSHPTAKDLETVYTPSATELAFAERHARRPSAKVGLLIFLKVFQRLGYFPAFVQIPKVIISHIAQSAGYDCIPKHLDNYDETGARPRHAQIIRAFLDVTAVGPESQEVMKQACLDAATTKDDLADIVNVAIEELVRRRFELPAFGTLVRAAKNARFTINDSYHQAIFQTLGESGRTKIDALLAGNSKSVKSLWSRVKQEPKKPTVGHMRDLASQLQFLRQYDLGETAFSALPDTKLHQFATEATSLDAASMRDLATHKRYALAAALIRIQAARALDDIADMFIKRMQKIHSRAREALNLYHLSQVEQTHALIAILHKAVIAVCQSELSESERLGAITMAFGKNPGQVMEQCESFRAHAGNNYFPFLPRFYKGARSALLNLLEVMPLISTSSDDTIIKGISFLSENRTIKSDWLPLSSRLDLSWVSEKWWSLVVGIGIKQDSKITKISRRYFELCLLSQVMLDLKSGDLAIVGGDRFADYRSQLLTWEEYEKEKVTYGNQVCLPIDPIAFILKIRADLSAAAEATDKAFPKNQYARFENGEVILSKMERRTIPDDYRILDKFLDERIPQINIVDVLTDTDHWINWTKAFGPLSRHEGKITNPRGRYIATTFCYGCNLGPTQTAQSIKIIDRRQISIVNQRHSSEEILDEAITWAINTYNRFDLPRSWGTGKRAAADGTKWDLYEQNLLSEYHIRHGSYGGIGYYHVSDTYIAFFSKFIPCGVWEGVHILDILQGNRSDIQPEMLHGDTQAQSAPVFALAYLLGIKLMPRIRNWKDLKLYRPEKGIRYQHLDSLFDEAIDWQLIETHYPDMLRVAMSIKAGQVTASTVLRRLGTYSRKNKLYFAFRELGRAIRTIFLLSYLSDPELRRTITATTNKCESYNAFTQWVAFGGGTITENNRYEQKKIIKYNHLVSNLVIIHTVDAMTKVLDDLKAEGQTFSLETLGILSPYRTNHINRFGDYTLSLDKRPAPLAFNDAKLV